MEYNFFGIPVIGIYCITTTNPKAIAIALVGNEIIQLPYTTYQSIRVAAGLPDIVCGENEIFPPEVG